MYIKDLRSTAAASFTCAHVGVKGIGRFTTEEEVDFAVESLAVHVERLRSMSPLWEMVQEGIDIKTIQWSQDAH